LQFITTAVGAVYGANTAIAAATGDFTSRAAVFDQYRIPRVDFFVKPLTQLALPGTTGGLGLLYLAIDLDDDTVPASTQEVLDYQNAVILAGGQGCTMSCKPCIQVSGASGAVGAAVSLNNQWLDCSSPNVKHFGLKWATPASSANQHTWILFARIHFEFKNPR
jgi:hypothetical protein